MTDRRLGVFICYCGGNISDFVDAEKVRDVVEKENSVIVAKTAMFTCSDATQQEIIEEIKEQKLDGIVVASCSPKLHLNTFRAMAERAGLNPYQYVQVNLREQCSWYGQGSLRQGSHGLCKNCVWKQYRRCLLSALALPDFVLPWRCPI
jgi:heterodisulfide reductase subunit A